MPPLVSAHKTFYAIGLCAAENERRAGGFAPPARRLLTSMALVEGLLARGRRARGQGAVEEGQDAAVLVGPRLGAGEAVVLHRVHGQVPVRFAQLDQALGEAHDV